MRTDNLIIQGDRVCLVMLTMEDLLLWLHDPPAFEDRLDVTNLERQLNDQMEKVFRLKIDQIFHDSTNLFWYTYLAVVVKEINTLIGLIGFKGIPDARGWAEIGYGMNPAFRNLGYATEAVKLLQNWSFQCNDLHAIVAETDRYNLSSMRVLEKAGFQRIEDMDTMIRWLWKKDPGTNDPDQYYKAGVIVDNKRKRDPEGL